MGRSNSHSALKNMTRPQEAFWGIKPTISHLQPFGKECYTHIPENRRPAGSKLLPRAEKGLFVGYTESAKVVLKLPLDTPGQLKKLGTCLTQSLKSMVLPEQSEQVQDFIDLALEKVTKHRDVGPRADTLPTLRNIKQVQPLRGRRQVGKGRVLTHHHVHAGILYPNNLL